MSQNDIALIKKGIDQMDGQFQAGLPAHIPVERFKRVLMTAIQGTPALAGCDRKSLFSSCIKAAQDGLLPDGREGALVPYKGQVQWLPMIAGIRKKVRNSGEIATWDVQAVYENDEFDFELGDDPYIKHKPALDDPGKIIAVYSIATLKSGEKSRDVMGIAAVEKIRSISRAKNGPWSNPIFYPEMAKKTVAHRHSKVLPMSTDLDDLIRRDDELYNMSGASDAAVKDVTPVAASIESKIDQAIGACTDDGQFIEDGGEYIDHDEDGVEREGGEATDGAADETPKDDPKPKTENKPKADDKPKADAKPKEDDQAPQDNGGDDTAAGNDADQSGADEAPDDEVITEAKDRGEAAFMKGRPRTSPPKDIKDDEALLAAWHAGFDYAKAAAAADE